MDTTNALPTHKDFLDTLLRDLASSTSDTTTTSNTTTRPLPPTAKNLLLTLHVLHPHHTLEALDLLDRGLITRLIIRPPTPNTETAATHTPTRQYHVRSAQGASHRSYRPRDQSAAVSESSTYYNVHLAAWSCSCPAFAYAAYPAMATAVVTRVDVPKGETLGFGGLLVFLAGDAGGGATSLPLCKHLLACVLAEECGELFGVVDARHERTGGDTGGVGIREKVVSVEEAAGWAAGGGDFG